jgi:hypothetical protein
MWVYFIRLYRLFCLGTSQFKKADC